MDRQWSQTQWSHVLCTRFLVKELLGQVEETGNLGRCVPREVSSLFALWREELGFKACGALFECRLWRAHYPQAGQQGDACDVWHTDSGMGLQSLRSDSPQMQPEGHRTYTTSESSRGHYGNASVSPCNLGLMS